MNKQDGRFATPEIVVFLLDTLMCISFHRWPCIHTINTNISEYLKIAEAIFRSRGIGITVRSIEKARQILHFIPQSPNFSEAQSTTQHVHVYSYAVYATTIESKR